MAVVVEQDVEKGHQLCSRVGQARQRTARVRLPPFPNCGRAEWPFSNILRAFAARPKIRQLCSHFTQGLNVPQGYSHGLFKTLIVIRSSHERDSLTAAALGKGLVSARPGVGWVR